MKETKKVIFNRLKGDTALVNMLGSNAPFTDPKGTKTKGNSILPAGKATSTTKTPFITIQGGPEVARSSLENSYDEFFYIRCYNDNKKAYIEISSVLERIKELLDGYRLSLTSQVNVKTIYEQTGAELEDEPLSLNFRESSYRVHLL